MFGWFGCSSPAPTMHQQCRSTVKGFLPQGHRRDVSSRATNYGGQVAKGGSAPTREDWRPRGELGGWK